MSDSYSQAVLADAPEGYWRLNEQSLHDDIANEVSQHHRGSFVGQPTLGVAGAISDSSNYSMTFAPQAHIRISHSPAFSIQTSGRGLSVEVWMRPDELVFSGEGNNRYVHWLGKGSSEKMEWGFRFHSSDHPKFPSRISAYAWNPQGGLGAGAYYQGDLVEAGEWLHVVACFEHYVNPCVRKAGVSMFVNGELTNAPPSRGTLYFNEGRWSVVPRTGDAPLRIATRSATADSFLTGGIDEVAIYPCVLTAEQIQHHFEVGTASY
jgi:hypothetical protein